MACCFAFSAFGFLGFIRLSTISGEKYPIAPPIAAPTAVPTGPPIAVPNWAPHVAPFTPIIPRIPISAPFVNCSACPFNFSGSNAPLFCQSSTLFMKSSIHLVAIGANASPMDIFKSSNADLNCAILFAVVLLISSANLSVAPLAFLTPLATLL